MMAICFDSPPPIGHTIRLKVRRHRRWLRLINVDPYTRKSDCAQSFVLTWLDDKGITYTSGLKAKSLTLKRHVERRP